MTPPGAGPIWTPGARLAGFRMRTTIHCYKQNMKALGHVVSEEMIFLCFTHDQPRVEPVWTPGAWLAGFIRRTTIHCYKQNMKALGHVVSEKIFLCLPMTPPPPPPHWDGARMDPRGTAGRIYKEDHYTLLYCYTQNMKALGLVVSKKNIFLSFSHDAPKAWPVWTPGTRLAGFTKRTTIHCYKQNMKALGLVVSEKIFFIFYP